MLSESIFFFAGVPALLILLLYAVAVFFGCAYAAKWRSQRMGVLGFLLFFLISMGMGESILHVAFVPSLLLFLLWTLPFMWVRGHSAAMEDRDLSRMKSQFIASAAGASLLFWLFGRFPDSLYLQIGTGLLVAYSLISAISYVIYWSMYGAPFHEEDMLPVLLSHQNETDEFIHDQLGHGRIIKGGIALVAGLFLYAGALSYLENPISSEGNLWSLGAACLMALIFLGQYFPESYPFKEWRLAKKSIRETREDIAVHRKNMETLKLLQTGGECGTVVLLIGESANRDHMKAFNPSYPADTTPWETEQKGKEGWYFFPRAYSCFTQTTRVLEQLLTGKDQYGRSGKEHLVSLLDIARAAGVKTYWLTNHTDSGDLSGYISHTAGKYWGAKGRRSPDENLLPLLDEIEPEKKSFIVIHLMGSHIRYADRYPEDFPEINAPVVERHIRTYDTSLAYTDEVLKKIFEKVRDWLKADAVVYLSDHSEDMKYTHGTGHFTFDMTRIPLWIWLSEEYRKKYPETAKNLKNHENRIFTNDLTFDLVSGLLHEMNSSYRADKDISSDRYDLSEENALTMNGTKRIKEDSSLLTD